MSAASGPAPAADAAADQAALAEAMLAAEAAVFARHERDSRARDALRVHRAHNLALAIADCDRADALAVISAALADLGAGMPQLSPIDRMREEARYWADTAAEIELVEYACAAMARLREASLGLAHRKQLLAALWRGLPDADRRAFLARVDPRGVFQGRKP